MAIERRTIVDEIRDFEAITLKLASPEDILSWSHGEVLKPETINYRTLRPERDGLFCEKIFGPTKDYECFCGKYKLKKYEGVVCERCGVTVTTSAVRRRWMGHITLAVPCSHIWFVKATPSPIALSLNIKTNDLTKVLYYENYIVTDPGNTDLKKKQILTEDQYEEARRFARERNQYFEAGMGGEAIRKLLAELDLDAEIKKLRALLHSARSKSVKNQIIKRLELFLNMRRAEVRPEWMIFTVIPVIPPDLRPLVALDGGRFATADLNNLYRRLIHRNNRLKKLTQMNAPEIILKNERRMLQEAVDALFDNSRKERKVLGTGNRPLKSLTDNLRGKKGRFRQNLLGKRVDYSGRSVIVVGPNLKLDQCGLPKEMALELFRPFIHNKLQQKNPTRNIKSLNAIIERGDPEVWEALEQVVKEHPVLLNRAPTLHRLGFQAFYPILIEGRAIQLHPLVCAAYNADFDGDQMAVHVPLSIEAQLESRAIILSTNNLLSPASGRPIVNPSQDMILGCYYLTAEVEGEPNEGKVFTSPEEVMLAVDFKKISLHTRIKVLIDGEWTETTPGRIIFASIVPDGVGEYKKVLYKKTLAKKDVSELIYQVYRKMGPDVTTKLVDDIKDIGFKYATLSGFSFSLQDLVIPKSKKKKLAEAKKFVMDLEEKAKKRILTPGEKRNKAIDVWTNLMNELKDDMIQEMKEIPKDPNYGNKFNPVYVMVDSGARGSQDQIKQLAAMRGPMSRHTGEIIETAITSNFREGLTVLEYFISIHGARKGLVDTALKTSKSGYLTRRLVDVAHSVIVNEEDCGTTRGIIIRSFKEYEKDASYRDKLYGRVAAEDIVLPGLGNVIVKAGDIITHEAIDIIEDAGINSVKVRSPLTCESKHGVCRKCYGLDLARDKLVELGEAVGVIAAQSIGEPGTQLTMRTFHIGGTAKTEEEQRVIVSPAEAKVFFSHINTVKDRENNVIVINNNATLTLEMKYGDRQDIDIPYGAVLRVQDGEKVEKGQVICELDPNNEPTIATVNGIIQFVDLVDGKTLQKRKDPETGEEILATMEYLGSDLDPKIMIVDEKNPKRRAPYRIEPNSRILVRPGQKVRIGDKIALSPRERKSLDITLGLPRVTRFFDLQTEDWAIISEIDGVVKIVYKEQWTGQNIPEVHVVNKESGVTKVYKIYNRKLLVHENQHIRKGDRITEGDINPRDLIKVKGEVAAQMYTVSQIQQVYRGQDININDKHVEVIVRMMTRRVRIVDPGDTAFLEGQIVHKNDFAEENERVRELGGKPATGEPLIRGIKEEALEYDSVFSAASFQATTKVLTWAVLNGATDYLRGLKENIIVGHLVPVGTGFPGYKDKYDVEILEDFGQEPLINA